MSDNTFTIITSSQFITVSIPNGGETWQVGSAQNIVWNSSGISNVKIEYTVNNGANWTPIIQSFPASAGSYTWAVPNTPSDQCKVKITDIGNPSLFDVSDNTFTIGTGGQSTPEICIVSVDSITNKNQVVWDKPYSTTISQYNIYREGNQANVYELIGSVPYNDVSMFTDLTSNPRQQANRYKISLVDIYNVETVLSNYHSTIHLSINQGAGNEFNLMWNHYEGFSYPSYNIYRGTSQNNMELFATISSTVNSFTDLYPPGGYVYYVIEVVKTNPCSPSRTEIISSRSNIGSNDPSVSIISPLLNKSSVQVYPNPTSGVVNIVSNHQMDQVIIYSIMGKVLKQIYTDETSISLDFSNEPKGVYILKVISNNSVWEGKVVMQ